MGWGNGQVDYGPAPIWGGGYSDVVYVEDNRRLNSLHKENTKLIGLFESMFISNRAWMIVSYTLANSKNKNDRSKEELNVLHRQAENILRKYVKKIGFRKFYHNVPPPFMLEP